MNKFVVGSLITIFLMAISSFAFANLLTNSGFDAGNLTGWNSWNIGDSSFEVSASQFQSPSYSFKEWAWSGGTPVEGDVGLWQDFAAAENFTYYISAYLKSLSGSEPLRDGANAYLKLEWRDGGGLIGVPVQMDLYASNDIWELFEISDTAPSGVVNGRVILGLWDPGLSGDSRAVYFDDARADIEPIPEPLSLLLLSSGLVGLGVLRKRKGKEVGDEEISIDKFAFGGAHNNAVLCQC